MLALSLIVVATALIGTLMQMYARNFATRGEDIRRQQLARSILGMIADDLRSVVTVQEFDASVLQQQLGAGAGGAGAGGAGAAGQVLAGQVLVVQVQVLVLVEPRRPERLVVERPELRQVVVLKKSLQRYANLDCMEPSSS